MLRIKSIKHRNPSTQRYIRHSYWKVTEVLALLKKSKSKSLKYFSVPPGRVKTTTTKNSLFLLNATKWSGQCRCDICGLVGQYFVLEKEAATTPSYHFNLYSLDPKTHQEIYFNIDHIRPKSKGGTNEMKNLQLTCQVCNSHKANRFTRYDNFKDLVAQIKVKLGELYHLIINHYRQT